MTLKELATQLGLSITTVSRALNGYDDVAPATRERILAAASRMGYAPNISAQRLITGRVQAVGVVLPLPAGRFADPFLFEMMIGLGEVLAPGRWSWSSPRPSPGRASWRTISAWCGAGGSTVWWSRAPARTTSGSRSCARAGWLRHPRALARADGFRPSRLRQPTRRPPRGRAPDRARASAVSDDQRAAKAELRAASARRRSRA